MTSTASRSNARRDPAGAKFGHAWSRPTKRPTFGPRSSASADFRSGGRIGELTNASLDFDAQGVRRVEKRFPVC